MKIFKDVFSGDELFSDTYEIKEQHGVLYQVIGKYETRKEGEVVLAGSNASAEGADADEGCDDADAVSGVNVILDNRLTNTGFGTKKDFTDWCKIFMKKVVKYLEDNNRAGEVAEFKAGATTVVKELLGKFKDLDFYTGESMDPDGLIVILDYQEIEGEEKPVLLVFKHAVLGEKV